MPEKQLSLRSVQGVAGWIFVSRTLTRKEGIRVLGVGSGSEGSGFRFN